VDDRHHIAIQEGAKTPHPVVLAFSMRES